MGWQRFNRASSVFEVSDDNGASWQTLVIAAAGLGVSLPSTVAYTDRTNVFSQVQFMPLLFLNAANPTVLRPAYDGAADTMDVVSGDQQRWAILRPSSVYSMAGGNNLGDLTVRGGTNFIAGIYVSAGNLTMNGSIVVQGSIQSAAPMYPAGGATAGVQATWYFGAHGSYGIYCNTGLYLESAVWPYYIEARAHVRAAGSLYDFGRGTGVGQWTDFTPQISNGSLAGVYCAKWSIVGHMMFISLNIIVASAGVNNIGMVIPAGQTNVPNYTNSLIEFSDGQTVGLGMAQCSPSDVWVYFYKNILANANWVGNVTIVGCICHPIA